MKRSPEADCESSASGAHQGPLSTTLNVNVDESENPFIQFRRLADKQISSVLQSVIGLPSLFNSPLPHARWIIIDEEDGAKRVQEQTELEATRVRQRLSAAIEAADRQHKMNEAAKEEMKKWGGTTATENSALPASSSDATAVKSHSAGNSSNRALGWDGQRRSMNSAWWSPRKSEDNLRYSASRSQELDPFTNSHDTLPWLLTDRYSPLHIADCIPFKVDGFKETSPAPSSDGSSYPFAWGNVILDPQYSMAPGQREHGKEIRDKVRWCDAFEDLISLQYKGKMLKRQAPSPTNMTWMVDMVNRGSLGTAWCHYDDVPFREGSRPLFWNRDTGEVIVGSKQTRYWGVGQVARDAWFKMREERDSAKLKQLKDLIREDFQEGRPLPVYLPGEGRLGWPLRKLVHSACRPPPPQPDPAATSASAPTTPVAALSAAGADVSQREAPRLDGTLTDDAAAINILRAADHATQIPKSLQLADLEGPSLWYSPEAVVQAIQATFQPEPRQESDTLSIPPTKSPQQSESKQGSASYFSSISSTAWSRSPDDEDRPESIISTLTTERRTLPDGSIQTKKILKKRFKDGREESSETTEHEMTPSTRVGENGSNTAPPLSGSQPTHTKIYKDEATSTDAGGLKSESIEKEKRGKEKPKGGWFWN